MQRSIIRLGVPLAVAALALSACGSRSESTSSSSGAATKVAKIGVVGDLQRHESWPNGRWTMATDCSGACMR